MRAVKRRLRRRLADEEAIRLALAELEWLTPKELAAAAGLPLRRTRKAALRMSRWGQLGSGYITTTTGLDIWRGVHYYLNPCGHFLLEKI